MSDGSDREDTCPEPLLTERERKERSGGREGGALPDGRNTQRANKLAETITYSDRPGGAVLLAGRRVGPEHGPSYLGWMGLSRD